MRILVLGGTGGIGPTLIDQLLEASHHVVIYARSPEKVPARILENPNVTIAKGVLNDRIALLEALENVEAVVSALGPPVRSGPFYSSGTPIAKGYEVVLSVMHEKGVNRLIALGTASIKDPNDKFDLEFWVLVNGVSLFARNAYKEIVAIGETIKAASDELSWTIVRVPLLTEKEEKKYYAGYVGDKKSKAWLSRQSFAAFVVNELEKEEWTKKAPLVSNP